MNFEQLLQAVFVAQGADQAQAARMARAAVLAIQLAGGQTMIERVDEDARHWSLREHLGADGISCRLGAPRRTVYHRVRRHSILLRSLRRIA